jgi:TadE-like protein
MLGSRNVERSAVNRLARSDRGTVMIEFAFILPLLLALVFGIMSFGQAMNYWINETQLASEAARWAVVDRSPGGGSLQSWIQSQADAQKLKNDMRVEISFPNGRIIGQPVLVKLCVVHNFLPFFKRDASKVSLTRTIVGSATMRIEQINTPPIVSAGGVGPGTCP